MNKGGLALAVAALAWPAFAEDALRPAPDYFVEAVVASTAAQAVARSCATLSLDPVKLQAMTSGILQRLEEDGFDVSRTDAGMLPSNEKFDEQQQAFLRKHQLDVATTSDAACAAGEAEMADGSAIGALLVEVTDGG